MNNRRYSKILAGLGIGLTLLSLVGAKFKAAADDPTWTLSYVAPSVNIDPLETYNGKIYAGGFDGQDNGRLYEYNGTTWTELNFASQIGVTVDLIEALQVFDNLLFIGTRVDIGGTKYVQVYSYDGTTFTQDFSMPGSSGFSGIEDLTIHNNSLYAVNGSPIGGVYKRIGSGNWEIIGSIIETGSLVRTIASYGGSLYAGTGYIGSDAKVWKWTGSSWVEIVDFNVDFGISQDGVWSLASANGYLYAGFTGSGNSDPIFAYDGSTWSKIIEIQNCTNAHLTVVDGSVWAGTECNPQIYRIDGKNWVDMGNTGEGIVREFTLYNGAIYTGTGTNGKIFVHDLGGVFPTYSISGHVTDVNSNGISGVRVSDGAGHSAITDNNGNYALSGLATGNYTITASQNGYTFSPPSRAVTMPPDAAGQDFTGTLNNIGNQNNALSAGERITYTAQTTIDKVRDISSDDLAKGLVDGGEAALGKILDLLGPTTKGLTKANALTVEVANEANKTSIGLLTDLIVKKQTGYDGFVKSWVDKVYKPMRDGINNQNNAYTAFVQSHQITWHSGYLDIENRWIETIRNEPTSGPVWTVVPNPPFLMPSTFHIGHLTFTFVDKNGEILGYVIIVLIVVALIIIIIGIIASIVASGGTATVGWIEAAGALWDIIQGLSSVNLWVGLAACSLALQVVFTGSQVSYLVKTDHQNALDELTIVLPSAVASSISHLQTTAQKVDGGVSLKTSLTNSGGQTANPLIETYVFNTSGHLVSIQSDQPHLYSGRSTNIQEVVSLPSGIYHIVTAANSSDHVGLAVSETVLFTTPKSQVTLDVKIDHPLVSVGEAIHASITFTNTGATASGDLALAAQYDGGKNGKSWVVNLNPGANQTIYYDFVPTITSLLTVTLESNTGVLASSEVGYVVGSGAILALNLTPDSVYQPCQAIQVMINGTNPGTQTANGVLGWTTTRTDLGTVETVKIGSVNLSINAADSQEVSTDWLDNAVPGDYTTQLTLDGLPRGSYSFSVQAADTLFAGLTSSCSECTINTPATVSLTVTNQSFEAVDPDSTTATITTPSGFLQNLSMTRISAGHYQGIYTPDTQGTYYLKASLTKANDQVIPTDMTFFVAQQSILSSSVDGNVFLHSASPITVTVTNELSVPIAEVSVSISNGTESLHGLTDSTGKINFTLMPQSLTSYTLTVEKPGFISANAEIPVQSTTDTTPPVIVLNIPNLTNQTPITVIGETEPGAQVTIDGSSVTVDSQGIFSAMLNLSEGKNQVHATAEDAEKNIGTADYMVTLVTTPPSLVVNNPVDQSNVSTETIPVNGTTEANAVLTVNDIRVDLALDGSFSTYALLVPGQNNIVITTIDAAGNVSTITRTVNYLNNRLFLPMIEH